MHQHLNTVAPRLFQSVGEDGEMYRVKTALGSQIFVGGLSGEAVRLKNDDGTEAKNAEGKPIILRKTLQLNYHIRGDEVYPGEDEVDKEPEAWVMR